MKKNKVLLLFPLISLYCLLLCCVSCTTAKKLTIMDDLQPNDTLNATRPAPVYHIKPKDNIYVSISTPDEDLSKMTDPTGNGVALSMAYEGAASRSINGNIVDIDGNITLPLLGKVSVAGLTIAQSEDTIRAIAKQYLKEATIKVRVLSFKITVLGEAKLPGVFYNYNNYVTILDAISLAGGTTDYVKMTNVLVLRPTARGTKTYSLNLNSKTFLKSDAYYLQPDDVVILQPGKNKGLQQKLPLAGVLVGGISALLLLINYLK